MSNENPQDSYLDVVVAVDGRIWTADWQSDTIARVRGPHDTPASLSGSVVERLTSSIEQIVRNEGVEP
jgi:hypothetical protein